MPDKAIDLVDEASSKMRLKSYTAPPSLKKLEEEVEKLKQEKEEAISTQDFEKAAKIRDKEKEKREEAHRKTPDMGTRRRRAVKEKVTADDIADIVSLWTDIPVKSLKEEESQRLLHLEEELHKRVVGQDEAVSCGIKAQYAAARVGLR